MAQYNESMYAQPILEHLKTDLLAARKAQDRVKIDALQAVLARISNAEAVPVGTSPQTYAMHVGVGSSEVARRVLSAQDIRQLIQDEVNDLQIVVSEMAAHDARHPYTAELKQKAGILAAYLQ